MTLMWIGIVGYALTVIVMIEFLMWIGMGVIVGYAIYAVWASTYDVKAINEYSKIIDLTQQIMALGLGGEGGNGNLQYIFDRLDGLRRYRKGIGTNLLASRTAYFQHVELRKGIEEWLSDWKAANPGPFKKPQPIDEEHRQGVLAIQEKYPWIKSSL